MKKKPILIFCIVFNLLFINNLFSNATIFLQTDEVIFEEGSYNEVLKKAKDENKIVMIDFFTDWCKWCVELDKKVYTNPEVAEFANKNQINWKIDAEKGEGTELAKKYDISGYPTILFVNPDGAEIDRIIGYLPADEFLKEMKIINAGTFSFISIKKGLEVYPDNVELNYKMAEKLINRGNLEGVQVYLEKVLQLDPENNKGYTDDAALQIAYIDGSPDKIILFLQQYSQTDRLKEAYIILADSYVKKNNDIDKALEQYDILFQKFGKSNESINSSYVSLILSYAYGETKKKNITDNERKKAIKLCTDAQELSKGSVNEASIFYYISELYYQMKDYNNAKNNIEKALELRDTKAYKEQQEKIDKALR
ncbi:MAG: DUF255 domain-containing protein [Ignavibacteria bacterium]|nr:DUF255 domain-containing protein [Ignavibacteria bacterium]